MNPCPAEIRRVRSAAQLLASDAVRAPVDIVSAVLAVQAQDFTSASLALRARAPGLDADALAQAFAEGSLVMSWLSRGTLHLVAAEDWPWLLAVTAAKPTTGSARRLAEEGVTPPAAERALAAIERALAADGPLTRSELRERVSVAGVRTGGQAMPHLLGLAAFRGLAVLCGENRYALARSWLPRARPVEREKALRELGVRYRRAHALSTPQDLGSWSGLPLREARVAWAAGSEPEVAVPPETGPRLLPPFDPYILGWKNRSFAVPAGLEGRVFPGGGMFRATATQDGKVVGTWTRPAGRVALADGADARAFATEAKDVERFLRPSTSTSD